MNVRVDYVYVGVLFVCGRGYYARGISCVCMGEGMYLRTIYTTPRQSAHAHECVHVRVCEWKDLSDDDGVRGDGWQKGRCLSLSLSPISSLLPDGDSTLIIIVHTGFKEKQKRRKIS